MPHGRDQELTAPTGAMLLLKEPVEFDAGHGANISVLLGLILPTEPTNGDLPLLARALRLPTSLEKLKKAHSSADAANIVLNQISTVDQDGSHSQK